MTASAWAKTHSAELNETRQVGLGTLALELEHANAVALALGRDLGLLPEGLLLGDNGDGWGVSPRSSSVVLAVIDSIG